MMKVNVNDTDVGILLWKVPVQVTVAHTVSLVIEAMFGAQLQKCWLAKYSVV